MLLPRHEKRLFPAALCATTRGARIGTLVFPGSLTIGLGTALFRPLLLLFPAASRRGCTLGCRRVLAPSALALLPRPPWRLSPLALVQRAQLLQSALPSPPSSSLHGRRRVLRSCQIPVEILSCHQPCRSPPFMPLPTLLLFWAGLTAGRQFGILLSVATGTAASHGLPHLLLLVSGGVVGEVCGGLCRPSPRSILLRPLLGGLPPTLCGRLRTATASFFRRLAGHGITTLSRAAPPPEQRP
mmetsp:Transcript_101216/g.226123  ORF Transcript_101216/g.226123 Transcript_101216/m.226123 type:complete len:242 (-) Transcript_101216:5-730(-)